MSNGLPPYRLAASAVRILQEAAALFASVEQPAPVARRLSVSLTLRPAGRPDLEPGGKPFGWWGSSLYLTRPQQFVYSDGPREIYAGHPEQWFEGDPVDKHPSVEVAGVRVRFLNMSVKWSLPNPANRPLNDNGDEEDFDEFNDEVGLLVSASAHLSRLGTAAQSARTCIAAAPFNSLCAWWAIVALYHRDNPHFVTLDAGRGVVTIHDPVAAASIVCHSAAEYGSRWPFVSVESRTPAETDDKLPASRMTAVALNAAPSAPLPSPTSPPTPGPPSPALDAAAGAFAKLSMTHASIASAPGEREQTSPDPKPDGLAGGRWLWFRNAKVRLDAKQYALLAWMWDRDDVPFGDLMGRSDAVWEDVATPSAIRTAAHRANTKLPAGFPWKLTVDAVNRFVRKEARG